MAVRGLTSLRSSYVPLASSSFVQLAAPLPAHPRLAPGPEQASLFKNAPGVFVSNPGRGLIPLVWGYIYKSPYCTGSQLNMAVRGIDCCFALGSLPAGSSFVQLVAPVVEPRSVAPHPPGLGYIYKARTSYSTQLKYGGEGGFEPRIRCRIHTLSPCVFFSHSPDTSPNCRSSITTGTGANGKYLFLRQSTF